VLRLVAPVRYPFELPVVLLLVGVGVVRGEGVGVVLVGATELPVERDEERDPLVVGVLREGAGVGFDRG